MGIFIYVPNTDIATNEFYNKKQLGVLLFWFNIIKKNWTCCKIVNLNNINSIVTNINS